MKNLIAILAAAVLFFGLIASATATDYRLNSARPAAPVAEPGYGVLKPPSSPVDNSFEPPIPGAGNNSRATGGGGGGFIEPALPEEPVFNYRFIDAGYVYHDLDSSFSSDAGHGGRVEIYHDIKGPFYATGNFRYTSADRVDAYGARLGVGAFVEIRDRVHLTLEGGGAWEKRKADGYSVSDTGYFVGPGIRIKFRQGVELFGNAYYRDVADDSGFMYRGGFVFDIKPKLDLTVAAEISDEENFYYGGVRYYF